MPRDRHTERVRAFHLGQLAVLAALALATPAMAQEDGVFIDPDSPTAKEYAIPLESERRQADPSQEPSGGIVQGERTSPLFGVGIVSARQRRAVDGSRRAHTAGSSGDGARKRSGNKPPVGKGAAPKRDGDEAVIQAATSNPGPPAGGAGVPLTIGGVAIGVLLLGGLVGLSLRRRA